MSAKIRSGRFSIVWRLGLCLPLLAVLAPAPGRSAASQQQQLALDCNSDLNITQQPMSPIMEVPGGTPVKVTLVVSSVLSTDTFNNDVPQVFDKVTYFRDCSATNPCVPNPAGDVSFVSLDAATTCPGTTVVNPATIPLTFDFVPDLILGPPSGASCNIVFDVVINTPDSYTSEAMTAGICQVPPPGAPLPSDTLVTSTIVVVPVTPTLGEAALWILAVALAAGSLLILRRRQSASG